MSLPKSNRADEIYLAIGQAIVDLLPENFLAAWATAEIHEEFHSFEIFYRKSDAHIGYIDEGLEKIEEGFRDLLQEFKDEKWTAATFKLSNAGAMSIDFSYEDITDFDLAPARRNAWISRYLGDSPVIDW